MAADERVAPFLGEGNRMSASSDENDTYATRPARSLSSPRTIASVVRGSVNANDRTSATVTTRSRVAAK